MSYPLKGLHAFVAVCEAGSISGGARALDVPRATVSRQVAQLEEELGVRLLHRSTRTLTRTASGEELYGRARRIVDDALAAREAVAVLDDTPRGLLRLSVPAGLQGLLTPVLLDFLRQYPAVDLEVLGTSRYVDLVAEGVDVAVRAGTLRDPSLIARNLRKVSHGAYASTAYVTRQGMPTTLEELADHTLVRSFDRGTVPIAYWPLLDGGRVAVRGPLAADGLAVTLHAVRAGFGIGLLPFSEPDLVPVLPEQIGFTGQLAIVYPERALLPAKVRCLVDHLVVHQDRFLPGDLLGISR